MPETPPETATATPPEAHSVAQTFAPAPARRMAFDRHYLLYVRSGALRLEAQGRRWSLAPARAALIRAGEEITVTLPQEVTAASALFAPGFIDAPKSPLTVFEMTPLARELAGACSPVGATSGPLTPYARSLFTALGAVALRLADSPSPTSMPAPTSAALARALDLTEAHLDAPPDFPDIARATGQSPRALARRFAAETGLTWRATLRQLRMIRAIELLAQGPLPVTEVALAVGYTSLSAFNAAFRDFTGTTPTAYRASFRNDGQ